MRCGLHAVPHAVGDEQGGGCWNGGLSDARLCRSYARDRRSHASDQQNERTRTHNTMVVSDETLRSVGPSDNHDGATSSLVPEQLCVARIGLTYFSTDSRPHEKLCGALVRIYSYTAEWAERVGPSAGAKVCQREGD